MAVNLSPVGNDAPFLDSSGNPLSGGLMYFYVGGSVGTLQNTYTTSAGNVANANPVVLDSGGYPAASGSVVEIWFTAGASYKAVLKTSAGVTVWSRDNLVGINDTTVTIDQWVAGPTPTYISATSFSLVGDQTSDFHVGRRVKTTNSGGTVYSTITASAYGAVTTVTVVNDSGTLDAGLSAVSYGLLSATNPSIDADMVNRKGTAVASATTTNIWGIAGDYVHITGTTTITGLGTAPYAGVERTVVFDGVLTLTHNATTLILPGGANITTAANDRMIVRADTTANMIVVSYIKASGVAVIAQNVPQKYISGITFANNAGDATNDIDFAAGVCTDSTGAVSITCAALTKRLDANWAAGTNQGMRNSAAAIADTGYYLWAVATATGTQDYYAHVSATAATVLTALQAETGGGSYAYLRLIGWINRVSAAIVLFHTYETEGGGIEYSWDVPTLDVNLANTLTTTRRTDAVKVPLLFSVMANLNVTVTDASAAQWANICNPDQTDAAPSATAAPLANIFTIASANGPTVQLMVRTSAAGLVAARSTLATCDLYAVSTIGFSWARRN